MMLSLPLFLLETLYLGDGTIKEDHRQTGCEQQCRNLVTKEPRRDCERMQWRNDIHGCSWKQCPVLRDDHSCKGINLPPFLIWDRLRLTYHHRVVKGTCKFETVHLGCWMPLTEFGWLFKHEICMDIINDMWNAHCYSLQPLNTASLTTPSPSNAVDWCRNSMFPASEDTKQTHLSDFPSHKNQTFLPLRCHADLRLFPMAPWEVPRPRPSCWRIPSCRRRRTWKAWSLHRCWWSGRCRKEQRWKMAFYGKRRRRSLKTCFETVNIWQGLGMLIHRCH